MKFRCERDVLVEALGAAGRAVANRGGALPVLSGVRTELQGDQLSLTGSDLELTIAVEAQVTGEDDGVAVLPAQIASDVVRSLEPGKVERRGRRTTRPTSPPAGSSRRSGCCPPTSSPGWAPRPRTRSPSSAQDFADALRQVVPAASADDARPILTGVLMAAEADGLRLVATDSYRLAVRDLPGQSVLREGQSVLVPSRALRELERLLGRHRRGHPPPRRARGDLRGRFGEAHDPADRGRVPELPRAHPVELPERADRRPRGPDRRGAAREADGPRGHARCG